MQTMTKSWTDERLEERFDRIEDRFDAVDHRFDAVDQRFDRVEADIRELRGELNSGFEQMRGEMKAGFDSLHRTMLQFSGALIIALIVGFVGIATQL